MEATPTTVEERIVLAAIECIEQYGIQGATNRRIAALAGVNSAAINYYFRSKDVLVQRVMQVTLENAFRYDDFQGLPGATAKERCAAIFDHLIEGGCNYPGITRAHFYDLLTTGNYASPTVGRLNEFIQNLADDLAARGAGLEREELLLACMQITAAAMMMILTPRIFEQKFGVDLHDAQTRRRFIRRLVDRLL